MTATEPDVYIHYAREQAAIEAKVDTLAGAVATLAAAAQNGTGTTSPEVTVVDIDPAAYLPAQ